MSAAKRYSIAIHGGAGTVLRNEMSLAQQQAYEQALEAALDAGFRLLKQGASALDAVEASVRSLEDCPLFNAGRGSVFNHAGHHEMDAAIMDGNGCGAGAVCGVAGIKNPVSLARMVMEHSPHVMLSGAGAEQFAKEHGVAFEPASYFFTDQRFAQWQQAVAEDRIQLDHSGASDEKKFGTVGAVALDAQGSLAAATSTGGMTNKRWGRVGDSPIIGAGTWASNDTCAVSCTGHGEFFIRSVVGHDIHCLMAYKNLSLQEACDVLVHDKLMKMRGEGGLIAVDRNGNIAMPFNSEGMYRASRRTGEAPQIMIYR